MRCARLLTLWQNSRSGPVLLRGDSAAHTVGGTLERSYARSDMLDRRRDVMEKWAAFMMGDPKETT